MVPSARVLLPSSLIALLLTSLTSARPYPTTPLQERAGSAEAAAWDDIPSGVSFISYWPAITTPVEGQVWQEGDSVQISWNGTAPPYALDQLQQEADIVLGYLSDASAGYHLDINNPLASVQLYAEPYSINITLPTNITSRTSYLLILGSSANSSPLFTIEGTGPAEEAATSSTALASSTSKAIEARPTTYVVGGQTTVLGQNSNVAAPAVSASQSQASFSDGNGGATASSSGNEASSTNTPFNSSSTQGPLAGATPSESVSDSAAPSPTSSPSSAVLASQEQTVTVTDSAASATPTSAAVSLKGSSWVFMAVGGALGMSLLL